MARVLFFQSMLLLSRVTFPCQGMGPWGDARWITHDTTVLLGWFQDWACGSLFHGFLWVFPLLEGREVWDFRLDEDCGGEYLQWEAGLMLGSPWMLNSSWLELSHPAHNYAADLIATGCCRNQRYE